MPDDALPHADGGNNPPPPASDTPWTATIWGEKPGTLADGWYTKAPDASRLAPYAGAKSFEDVITIAEKRVSDAQTALRNRPQGGLPQRPEKDAPPEHWEAYRKAHGLPVRPEDYGLTRPETISEKLWSDAKVGEFAKVAHELDLPPDKVKSILDWYHTDLQNGVADHERAEAERAQQFRVAESAELGKRFGAKLDGTLKDLQAVAQSMNADTAIFDPGSDKFWGVEAVSLFARMLERVPRGEDGTVRSMGAPTGTGQYDIVWAKEVLKKGHPDNEALTNPRHPRHEEIVQRRNEAYALHHGGN